MPGASDHAHAIGRAVGLACLVLVGVALGVWLGVQYSALLAPFLAAALGYREQPKPHQDYDKVEQQVKEQVLAQSPADVVASLDADTQQRIADAKQSAISQALDRAKQLTARNGCADGGTVHGSGDGGSQPGR
jgi:hypothetical protein